MPQNLGQSLSMYIPPSMLDAIDKAAAVALPFTARGQRPQFIRQAIQEKLDRDFPQIVADIMVRDAKAREAEDAAIRRDAADAA